MATVSPKGKANNADLPTLINQNVVVRSNVDNSERRGTVGYFDSVKNMVRVDDGRTSFWVSTINNQANYIYLQ